MRHAVVYALIAVVGAIDGCAVAPPHTLPLHTSPLHLARESPFIGVTVHTCYDGDTCIVSLNDPLLPAVFAREIPVRLAGIDTPEIRGQCSAERDRAIKARDFLRALLAKATRVDLIQPKRDKYFRLLAGLRADGHDVAQALVQAGLARPYDGGTKPPWC